MRRTRRFWYRLNSFTARFTAPTITDRGATPPTPTTGGWTGINTFSASVINGWGSPFRTTLIDTDMATLRAPGYLPERPWWDQRGENNPWPLDPPEALDLSGLDLINARHEGRWHP